MPKKNKPYGIELILDLKECDEKLFTFAKIDTYCRMVCSMTKMKRHGRPMYWENRSSNPKLRGVSAVQFIKTSQIVCHCLDMLRAVYINVFTCKPFNTDKIKAFSKKYWKAKKIRSVVATRI